MIFLPFRMSGDLSGNIPRPGMSQQLKARLSWMTYSIICLATNAVVDCNISCSTKQKICMELLGLPHRMVAGL